MNQNTEFLNYIYQNAQMGIDAVKQLSEKTDDPAFGNQLRSQLQEYQSITDAAVSQLHQSGHTEKDLPKMAEIGVYMSIEMKSLTNHSPQHISEMMIQGSNKGIIEITKNMKKYPDAALEIKQLADKLLKIEQSNIESLKSFL